MINEQMKLSFEAIMARLAVLEEKVARLEENASSAPAPTGAHGTMTVVEHKMEGDINGYVTPISQQWGANVRRWPSTSASNKPLYKIEYGQSKKAIDLSIDIEDHVYTWYQLEDLNYVRSDVVTFSKDKPLPAPIQAARWPAPLSAYRVENTHLNHRGHKGIDLSAPHGASILTPVDAFVLKAFECTACKPGGDGAWTINNDIYGDGYGSHLILRCDASSAPLSAQPSLERFVFVLFGHLSTVDVVQGYPVRAESPIGRVGSTGNSTGPHLHIEARTSDTPHVNFYAARLIDPAILFDIQGA